MNSPKSPTVLNGIKNITVSGRIGTGKSTFSKHLAESLGWSVLDGGKIFRKLAKDLKISIVNKSQIPDEIDIAFEERIKNMLINEKNHVIQSHLAGFVAQGIKETYKILVVCEDENGEDKTDIRIDRLMNRDLLSVEEAKHDLHKREEEHLIKFRRLYVNNDSSWVYWKKEYYDLIINTYSLNQEEALKFALKKVLSQNK